ncbi:type 1 glutamine amidotransferase [Calditrichota bacterium GD2]
MRVHFLQHVPFETPGILTEALKDRADISFTRFFNDEALPRTSDLDLLVVMGGPMSVHDESAFSWLKAEKRFIEQVIDQGKRVLGICLGAQMLAEVLGARVFKGAHREIGWFDITRAPEVAPSSFAHFWPETITAFHWHGEMFEIPAGARCLAFSQACENQGFVFENRVWAFQFHLEVTPQVIEGLLKHCADELDGSAFVQSAEEIRQNMALCRPANALMRRVVEEMAENALSV